MFLNFADVKPVKEFKEILPECNYLCNITGFQKKEVASNPKTKGLWEVSFTICKGDYSGEVLTDGLFMEGDETSKIERTLRHIQGMYSSCNGKLFTDTINSEQEFYSKIVQQVTGKQLIVCARQWKSDKYWNTRCASFLPISEYKEGTAKYIPTHKQAYLDELANPSKTETNNNAIPQSSGIPQQYNNAIPQNYIPQGFGR